MNQLPVIIDSVEIFLIGRCPFSFKQIPNLQESSFRKSWSYHRHSLQLTSEQDTDRDSKFDHNEQQQVNQNASKWMRKITESNMFDLDTTNRF